MYKLRIYSKPKPIKMKCSATFPPIILANLQEKETIPTKETQEIVADKTYDGLSKVTVHPIPNEYIVPSGEVEFTQNGTYDVTDKASAKVNIKEKVLGTKTITSNGTYKAIDDNLDGYSEVEVVTSGVDINEYMSDTITNGTSNAGGWVNTILKLRSPLTIEGSNASYMFYNYQLNEIPQLDTSNVTNMSYMFYNCVNLITIPSLKTNKVTKMEKMFLYCKSLVSIKPQFNTSNVTNMYQMFSNCQKLVTLDLSNFDFSSTTNLQEMFYLSTKIENLILPNLHTNATERTTRGMFSRLEKIKELDLTTLNATYSAMYMFDNCKALETLSAIDCSKNKECTGAFNNCTSLKNFGGMINLGQAYPTTASANNSDYKLALQYSHLLTHDSLMNVINNLYDIATKGVKPQQLILGPNNLAKLTEEEIKIATDKGWNVS